MRYTDIVLKDGRKISAPMMLFRPEKGYMTLMGIDEKFYFKDMVSAVTKNERIRLGVIGDEDEINRAKFEGWVEDKDA